MARLFAGTPFDQPPRCERCELVESDCRCPPPPRVWAAPHTQTARLKKESRKKGKTVTVIAGLPAVDNDLGDLVKRLKQSCGAGGTVAGDTIEIQGDHLESIAQLLKSWGFRVK